MAKFDLGKLRIEAEQKFPGDRAQQDAYIAVHSPPVPIKKRASTVKKKTPAKKPAAAAKSKRRRF